MENTPRSFTSDPPDGATLPSTIVGRNTASGYFAVSKISLCIRASRDPFPLSPLVASTIISPPALPVCGSKCTVPLFKLNVPCTVCSVLSTFQCTCDCPGSTRNTTSEVAACAACGNGGAAAADRNTAKPNTPSPQIPSALALATFILFPPLSG